ncbi:MAG: LysM peptidoglycan-binding domain-containing protein [Candidatus Limnocylindrales bacterium]
MSDETVTSFHEGHAACPFVAFEDDRDHRADHPDYRHRCFAAAEPEPRALPHQERFCLSAAFAQCPIFLDWARQEAAGVATKTNGAASAAGQTVASAGRVASVETPAFLASRGRTTPAEAGPVTPHSTSDPGSGLWGFEGAPKRTVAPVTAPATGSSSPAPGTPAYTMARRQPTRPDWENPPRLDNFPRLRAREDRNNNQPLLLAALGVAVLMVVLIVVPLLTSKTGSGDGANPSASGSQLASGASGAVSSAATDTPVPTPEAERTLMVYYVTTKDKTLSGIAFKFGISLTQLELANPLSGFASHNYNIIYPGMTIYIPWQTWLPSPTPTPAPTPTPTPSPTPKPTPTPAPTPTPTY